jgi:hypothetical protein
VLVPEPETAFQSQHNFNPHFIKTKGIKKIVFEIIDKKDYEVAVDKSLIETYEFSENGRLSRYYYTSIKKTIQKEITKVNRKGAAVFYTSNEYLYDTISTTYFYAEDKLILKRYHDGANYYESRYYRYDSLGNLTKELRFKETNNSPDLAVFILGNQVLLSEDSFQYHKYSSGQERCVFLNNENRPYKVRISNFDSLGRKKNMSENYTAAAWIMQEHKYTYEGRHLVAAQFDGNANNKILLRNTFEYDENEELYTEKQYRNEILEKEISYVTTKADSLLNSIVIRDPINKTIRIIRLNYDFGMLGNAQPEK